jgi:hypothetical protein
MDDDGRAVSGRDFLILFSCVVGAIFLFSLGRKYLVPSMKPESYVFVDCAAWNRSGGDGCCVQGMVRGNADDDLVRLTGHGKQGRQWTEEVVIWRKDGSRTRLASHVKTPRGKCVVVRYVLKHGDTTVDTVRTDF